jgi:hypothetical protein
VLAALVEHEPLGERVLHAGCGMGPLATSWRPRGSHIQGEDELAGDVVVANLLGSILLGVEQSADRLVARVREGVDPRDLEGVADLTLYR